MKYERCIDIVLSGFSLENMNKLLFKPKTWAKFPEYEAFKLEKFEKTIGICNLKTNIEKTSENYNAAI